MDLSETTNEVLTFESAKGNEGPTLEVLVSTTYDGVSDPTTATWTPLTATLSTGNFAFVSSGNVDISTFDGQSVYIAFRYQTTGTAVGEAATWQVDNIEVRGDVIRKLEFSLAAGAPVGAMIDPDTGDFSWTPTEIQGKGDYPITVLTKIVGDALTPLDAATFTVTVNEVNMPPMVTKIGDKVVGQDELKFTVDEETNLSFSVEAEDQDNTNMQFVDFVRFDNFSDVTLGDWTAVSVSSNKNWQAAQFGITYAQINGFGADTTSDDWLISPSIDLNNTMTEFLSFSSARQGGGQEIEVLISTDYDGAGDPSSGTWDSLSATLPTNDNEFIASGNIDLTNYTDDSVYIAFRYTSTGTTAGTAPIWQVTDIAIKGSFEPVVQKLTYTLEPGAPAGAAINSLTGAFSWTPTETQGPNNFSITVKVTDDGVGPNNLSVTETIQITVNEVNKAPVLSGITDKTINEETELKFSVVANDIDLPANTLTYELTVKPSGASINSSTGEITWIPTEAQGPGIISFTVKVSDNGNPILMDTEDFKVTVNEVNKAPVITTIADKTINEQAEFRFSAVVNDVDLPANTLTYELTNKPVGASINSSTGEITWTPAESQGPGIFDFTLKVSDNGDPVLMDTEDFKVTVDEVNRAPVITTITDVPEALPQQKLSIQVIASDVDIPANTLTYSLMPGSPAANGATIDANTGLFMWTPTKEQGPNTYTVIVKVFDGLATTQESFNITVPGNSPPTLNPIGDKDVDEETLLTFTATFSDIDFPGQTLTFSLMNEPDGAVIDGASGVFSWTPTEVQGLGIYTFKVIVTDNGDPVKSDSEEIMVTVNEINNAPVLTAIGDKSISEKEALTFTATANDVDRTGVVLNLLSYSLEFGTPAATGATINQLTGAFSWTPTESQGQGIYPVTIRVTDDNPGAKNTKQLNDSETFDITVNEINEAPQLVTIGSQTVDEETKLTVDVDANDVDLDITSQGNDLTYSIERIELVGDTSKSVTGAQIDSNTGVFTWTPTEEQGPGDYKVNIVVTDDNPNATVDDQLTDTQEFSISVDETNKAPTVSGISKKVINEEQLFRFSVTASDSDIPANNLTFSLENNPAGTAIDQNSGEFSWTPLELQGPGTYEITVVITDNNSNAAINKNLVSKETVTIEVNEIIWVVPEKLTGTNLIQVIVKGGTNGDEYIFQSSEDLKIWNQLGVVTNDGNNSDRFIDPSSSSPKKKFYRVIATPATDTK